ncbi:MAG: hypothetical protein JWM20_919 [Patescibacteria group bacterium]|nr:hypothetical protein [Patescibacteria group bacterium]
MLGHKKTIFQIIALEFFHAHNKKNIVYIDGEVLEPLNPEQINSLTWGYAGGGPAAFRDALLKKLNFNEKLLADMIYEWIQSLPQDKSIVRTLDLKKLIRKKYGKEAGNEIQKLAA